jgi:hypothetical protein
MHKNATKCNKTLSKWCKNKHGASKIIDTFEMFQTPPRPAAMDIQGIIYIIKAESKKPFFMQIIMLLSWVI